MKKFIIPVINFVLLLLLIISCEKDKLVNDTITDIDGNSYKTVKIGDQIWMAENLKTTKYNDGISIPLVSDNTEWKNSASGAHCWYNNDSVANATPYGALYNWYAINTISNGGKNVCPTGWHLPTDAEWTNLTDYLGGESFAGCKLRETGTTHWSNPNSCATNETGFTALPGGDRDSEGNFGFLGSAGGWWSSSEYSSTWIYFRSMSYSSSSVRRDVFHKEHGLSVRCIKN